MDELQQAPVLDGNRIRTLLRRERVGTVFCVLCGAVLLFFAVSFTVASVLDINALRVASLAVCPALTVIFAAVAAFCNVKYGNELDKIIKDFVREVFLANAALMRSEKQSINYYIDISNDRAEVKANNYKEGIIFDFSAFKKLSVGKKSAVAAAISQRLVITFMRLYERGIDYREVSYCAVSTKKKKVNYIIKDGQPDKRAAREYLKAEV